MGSVPRAKQTLCVEIIKPSHYDDDGYVIQWFRSFVPSNSLACLYALVEDVQRRGTLGCDVEIVATAYDESHTIVPIRKIIQRIRANAGRGVVFLAGVQTNQFSRAADLAREFRQAGVAVVIGGFHVSGCVAMLPGLPEDLRALQDLGVTLFAGEAEGRMAGLLQDALRGTLPPLYNYLGELPALEGQPVPFLPRDLMRRSMFFTPFDCGRGCPFNCSFCTIINVQGRKSRSRSANDVENLLRASLGQGVRRFFITDDNLARNKNWEAILDRLIAIREQEKIYFKVVIQVDAMTHKIPGFIEKATLAGCNRVFIGLESINPKNLVAANKPQNCVADYREMLQAWRAHHVMTHAGYILGLPDDTPESIEQDIRTIQKELPIDILEFMLLTPLPGSADHRALWQRGASMDPDWNKYDVEHVTVDHPRMSAAQWREIYQRAWHLYYSPDHVERLMRRAKAMGAGARHLTYAILSYYGSYRSEKLHPLQCGLWRRKVRTDRRPGLPRENPLSFCLRRGWDIVTTYTSLVRYWIWLERVRHHVERDPAAYTDAAIAPAESVPPGLTPHRASRLSRTSHPS